MGLQKPQLARPAAVFAIFGGKIPRTPLWEITRIEVIAMTLPEALSNSPLFHWWEKDRAGRYTAVNENYARAAGYDSPNAMLGKTDFDMPWRSLADEFRAGDAAVMAGNGLGRVNVLEREIMVDRDADILVTEQQLITGIDRVSGVVGFFLDVTDLSITRKNPGCHWQGNRFYLGEGFGNEYLTRAEYRVLSGMLNGKPASWIAEESNRAVKTIRTQIDSIKGKLQVSRKGEIIAEVTRHGLQWIASDLDIDNS